MMYVRNNNLLERLRIEKKGPFPRTRLLYGGTFDPIHLGHISIIQHLSRILRLERFIILPNRILPKSFPTANVQHRLKMIQLALKNNPLFQIDLREIQNKKFSYTIDTLRSFRSQIGWKMPLGFIIGEDILSSIHTWFKWREILQLCNLLVCKRGKNANYRIDPVVKDWINRHRTKNKNNIFLVPYGTIYFVNNPFIQISSTEIRRRSMNNQDCKDLLPDRVLRYINKNKIYQK
ncbi:nicotinate-nucleotide adenylyltransferase [Candidatus Riesia pediculischaeffi]|uniref:Probable nicotinate-nucleotide adenylyltransferase n=1 Tax=Candidatus Riesia pediculischaeffi TaxID=428411 RepID=A0A1V0HKU7_9ENTR|nr:nicotinate-nucleotide adenylyltransferase [Candidatus Riesia pediculischaeffi]ARC53458.1 hypothetical protein AOQ87_02265 [Candidatus Riesia pediculischaeffi]